MKPEYQELGTSYDAVKMTAIQFMAESGLHEKTINSLKSQYRDIVTNLKTEKESVLVQETSIQILKEVIDRISQEHIGRIVDLLTYALQTIFYDMDYSVEVVMGDKRNNKTAEFYLVDKTDPKKIIRSSFVDGTGGGVLAVIGFVLQVYYIGYLNQAPIMFVDEGFSQVSSHYIDTLVGFINELSEQRDFIFVLISHDDRLTQYAKRTYQVERGEISRVG